MVGTWPGEEKIMAGLCVEAWALLGGDLPLPWGARPRERRMARGCAMGLEMEAAGYVGEEY